MFDRGYVCLLRLRGVPVRTHWTLPVGLLLFSGGRFAPGIWIGMLTLIVLHEMGHAWCVRRAGLVNLGIDITALGGRCRWAGSPSAFQRSVIAWGGVVAQLVVLAVTFALVQVTGPPTHRFGADLVEALLHMNLVLIGINLVPLEPLDGAEAWPLLRHLRDNARRRRKWKSVLRPSRRPAAPTSGREDEPMTLREALERASREERER